MWWLCLLVVGAVVIAWLLLGRCAHVCDDKQTAECIVLSRMHKSVVIVVFRIIRDQSAVAINSSSIFIYKCGFACVVHSSWW